MKLTLTRHDMSSEGTFGEIFDPAGKLIACTCERPDNGNQKMGCIPVGEYEVRPFASPSKGHVFLVHDVPKRNMIEIHAGNTIDDTEGCILVGSNFGVVHGKKGIVNSRATLETMLEKYPDGFTLEIVEA